MTGRLESTGRKTTIAATLLVALVAGLVLVSLRASEQTADSLDYAHSARTGIGMYHPHHLLFVPLVRLLLSGLSFLDISSDPIAAGQAHDVLWAMVAVTSLFVLARRLLASEWNALLAASFLLLERGFWLYCTQLEVYVPATGCLALLTALLLHRSVTTVRAGFGLILALLWGLSVLYHQSNLFFAVPLGYWLVRDPQGGRWRNLWIMPAAGLVVLSAYLLAFQFTDVEARVPEAPSLSGSGLSGFARFCLAYAYHPSPGWGTWRNFSPMGIGRLLHSQIRDLITFPWPLRFVVIPGFALLVIALAIWHLLRSRRGGPDAPARRFLLIWLATYYLFFLWWFPGEKEFFITPLFPLTLLAALAVKDFAGNAKGHPLRRRLTILACPALLAGLGVLNLTQTILPYHRDRGPAYAAASQLAGGVPADCLVMGDYSVGQNLRYYFGRERFVEMAMPLFYFYRDLPLPERYAIDSEECIVADLSFVSPAYSLGGFDAYGNPERWSRFLEWLLGVERGPAAGDLSCRKFEGIGDIEGSAHLRLAASREPVPELRQIYRRLDDELATAGNADRPFEAFLDATAPPSLPRRHGKPS